MVLPVKADESDWDAAGFDEPEPVNEGGLHFLSNRPAGRLHHHANRVTIAEDSLLDGWVTLDQCHTGLDPVSKIQIVYHPERVRELAVVAVDNVQSASVDGARVLLAGVGDQARVCIRARSLALVATEDGGFMLRNGPYMRRFLDGFYPMRVSMSVSWPQDVLRLTRTSPVAQPGFVVTPRPHGVDYEALFEGRLVTEIHFAPL